MPIPWESTGQYTPTGDMYCESLHWKEFTIYITFFVRRFCDQKRGERVERNGDIQTPCFIVLANEDEQHHKRVHSPRQGAANLVTRKRSHERFEIGQWRHSELCSQERRAQQVIDPSDLHQKFRGTVQNNVSCKETPGAVVYDTFGTVLTKGGQ